MFNGRVSVNGPNHTFLDLLESIVPQNIIPMFATCPQKNLSFFGVRVLEQVIFNPYYTTINQTNIMQQ